jgi:hypothetical protein
MTENIAFLKTVHGKTDKKVINKFCMLNLSTYPTRNVTALKRKKNVPGFP